MTLPSVRLLTAAVVALLEEAAPTLTVYRSVVTDPPKDSDGGVQPYAVVHPGAGAGDANALDDTPAQLAWPFQITCVGGDVDRCTWAVDAVRDQLDGATLMVAGATVGRLREDGDSGPLRVDDDVTPPRLYLPLLYRVLAVPA